MDASLQRISLYLATLVTALLIYPVTGHPAPGTPVDDRTVKFKWEPVDWGIRYRVQIQDQREESVLDSVVASNQIEFSLPPGQYKMRIGIINKFEKIGYWTDWTETEITPKPPWKVSAMDLGIKVGVGMPYVHYFSPGNSPFENSFSSYTGRVSFRFGDFILFKPQDINYTGILNFLGAEFDWGYSSFTGRDIPGKITTDMTVNTVGAGMFAATNFRFPVNLIFRAGGGVALTQFVYQTEAILGKDIIASSQDPFYRVGAAVEFTFLKVLFLEIGADYHVISYIDSDLPSMRYYGMLGVKL